MNRNNVCFFILLLFLVSLTGCNSIGNKSLSISVVYSVAAISSLFLLIGYCCLAKARENWFLLLFTSVLVVNIGYFSLSISFTIEEALLANRISYLGSVFLPMSMLMIILNVTKVQCPKWVVSLLLVVGIIIFLIAASPGYLDIYYKEVFLERINGTTILNKVYGPLHCLYLFYLLLYFITMIAFLFYAILKKHIDTATHAIILAFAVFVNIGVWLLEQLVKIDFEILSVSYIISEIFLLGLNVILAENEGLKDMIKQNTVFNATDSEQTNHTAVIETPAVQKIPDEQVELFLSGLCNLTPTERIIYEAYVQHKSTKDIMSDLGIKENTLKFHNKNIYSKLGVSSRKQLVAIYKQINL